MLVLVVEDEAIIRMMICDALEDAGHRCTEAADAAEALALLEQGGCRPGLLVTDFNLGAGPDGKALAQAARRLLPGLPVVYATGNADLFPSDSLGAGERLVPKPFTCEELLRAAEELSPPGPRLALPVLGGWQPAPGVF